MAHTKVKLDKQLAANLNSHLTELKRLHSQRVSPLLRARQDMVERHRAARDKLTTKQQERWAKEHKERQQRFKRGLGGLWERMTGKHAAVAKQNENESYQCLKRDQEERDNLVRSQLGERDRLQSDLDKAMSCQEQDRQRLKEAVFNHLKGERENQVQLTLDELASQQQEAETMKLDW